MAEKKKLNLKRNAEAKRKITVKIDKPTRKFKAVDHDLSTIKNLASKTIHNLKDEEGVIVFPNKGRGAFQYLLPVDEYKITLTTEDSSYDLSAFYTELTKSGYIIK